MKNKAISLTTIAILLFLCGLFVPETIFCQTETLEGVQYTPPKGWTKTPKEGAAVYTIINKTTNAFCLFTIYGSSPSAGTPSQDFAKEWDNLVVKPFKAQANPKTETQTAPEGWQGTAGGAEIEMSEGIKAIALLTVFTGFGKKASVLTIFNDQSYLAQMQTFLDGIKLDKTQVASNPPPPTSAPASEKSLEYYDFDPFPDKQGVQPQKPLIGGIRKKIAMADLAGTWEIGGASVQTYVSSSTQQYQSASFFGKKYVIRANGTFDSKFQGRASNTTIRETDSGTIILSGGFITMKSNTNPAMRYQYVAYMTQPNGAAVLSLIYIGDNPPLDNDALIANCSHPNGYVSCLNGEEWVRIP